MINHIPKSMRNSKFPFGYVKEYSDFGYVLFSSELLVWFFLFLFSNFGDLIDLLLTLELNHKCMMKSFA